MLCDNIRMIHTMLRAAFTCAILCAMLLAPAHLRAAETGERILLGLIPEENIFTQMKRHRPLAQYMTKKLGLKVEFTILSRYPHIITRFERRKLDGAFFGIFTSVLAEESLSVEPVVRSVGIDGRSTARGVIFVRNKSGLSKIAQLKGKRAAVVDQVTATGYLYLLYHMREKGIRSHPDAFFSQTTLTGSHDSSVYSVLSGQAEVGAAKDRIMAKLAVMDPLVQSELRIIATSEELPDNTLYLRRALPINIKLGIQQILMQMKDDPEGRTILKNYGSSDFIEAKSSDFAPVRKMARESGINVKNFRYDKP